MVYFMVVIDMTTLTNRQEDVLLQIMKGKTNNQIAKTLFVSNETVKEHVSTILKITNLENRTQLAVWGFRRRVKVFYGEEGLENIFAEKVSS
jgi:DNA-binding NarL/FixJ family response regulator